MQLKYASEVYLQKAAVEVDKAGTQGGFTGIMRRGLRY
jgi:hypothetical protein